MARTKSQRRVVLKWGAIAAFLAVVIGMLLALALGANGTTLARMSVAQMAQRADLIVRARCEGNTTAWDAGEIWTFTTFAVEESWKGEAPEKVHVRLLGGRAGEVTSTVDGVPRFREGEEVVVFLERTTRGDFSVLSWIQGTFRIRRNARTGRETATQDTAAFAVYNPAVRRFEAAGAREEGAEQLKAEVLAAVAAGSGAER